MSRGTVWGRIYLLFWKKSCFSFRFRTSRLFLAASGKIFFAVLPKIHSTCPLKNFAKKLVFPEKEHVFFNLFWTWCHFSAIIPTFWGNSQNSIPSFEMHFEESFFKKSLFVTLGHEAKRFDLLTKNFRQGCQTSFYVCTGTFWGIIYFSKKGRFFSIIFEYWVVLFWRTRHNCMLRVQIRFR